MGQGTKPSWCVEPHIHVSMVKRGTGSTIDPTGYLRKRKMPPPRWVQECDHYVLRWLVGSFEMFTLLAWDDVYEFLRYINTIVVIYVYNSAKLYNVAW